ncbi:MULTISPECIES: NUDIX domain-containing protein [unclassified Nocardioides]|uniref:NUDIX domain-containing protein n=1 Tax=Nocardioides sp. URHA0032 TaxID=1380388 RepID=UPI000689138F|nr:NUDIX hydrolase [Nocardioides sp. URHA0032]
MQRFASVILVDPRGWLLLQERDELAAIAPEKWGLVGGHVEPGEEFETAAYRELAEETGIDLPAGALTLWREPRRYGASFSIWYAGVDLTDTDVVVGEGRQIVFVDPAAMLGLDLTDLARWMLPEFVASAQYRDLREELLG